MMLTKDYYKILEVTPAAAYTDIKKSYRRLAIKYHPDKNFGNVLYEAKFKEIQEAYQVLSDEKKRQEYNERLTDAQAEKKKPQTPVTPIAILNQAVDFRKKIAVLDPDRMNKLALFQQIQHLLSRPNIMLLKQHNDHRLNRRIIEEIMSCSRFLPFPHVEKICFQLTALAGTDNGLYQKIFNFSRHVWKREMWNRYKLPAALIVALVLCFIIYLIGDSI